MTTIPNEIHARLSASERIRAAVSAMARGDTEELKTLRETCPKASYLMTDPAYSDAVQRLLDMAMAVEADLRGLALDFFLAARGEDREAVNDFIRAAVALDTAWGDFLEELGIPRREMAEAGPPRHHAVAAILLLCNEDPAPDAVHACLDSMREALAAA